jgi:translation initiation factor 3 subunit A
LHSINLSDPDTLQRHLDTRFAQLSAAVELELWQEAFRSVEDVHNLLTMAKKAPRPSMMANYYEKLTRIFLMSGNALYHAAAWGKYHQVITAIGSKSDVDLGRLAGQVLVSTLAVPVGQAADEEGKSKSSRLMSLLGLTKPPTRTSLLQDALARGVLKLAPESVKALYSALEVTFDPLNLCPSVAPLLKDLAADEVYASYLPLLQSALLSRLLSQLSQVYSSISIDKLLELATPLREITPETASAFDDARVEAYVMGCARRGELNIRVDHAAGSIVFVDAAFGDPDSASQPGPSNRRDEQIQPSAAELVRTRLSRIATALHTTLQKVEPAPVISEEVQAEKLTALVAATNAERKTLQLRRAVIARRRELLQELSARKEQEEAGRRAEANRRRKIEEEKKAADDARRRAQEHAQREMQSIRDQEVRVLAENLKARGIMKVDIEVCSRVARPNSLWILSTCLGHEGGQYRHPHEDASRADGEGEEGPE